MSSTMRISGQHLFWSCSNWFIFFFFFSKLACLLDVEFSEFLRVPPPLEPLISSSNSLLSDIFLPFRSNLAGLALLSGSLSESRLHYLITISWAFPGEWISIFSVPRFFKGMSKLSSWMSRLSHMKGSLCYDFWYWEKSFLKGKTFPLIKRSSSLFSELL